MRQTRPIILAFVLLAMPPVASGADDPGRLLQMLGSSRTDLSYIGIQSVVALTSDRIGTVRYRISRYLSEMERTERVDDKNNVLEVVIDDKKSLFRYLPEKKTVYKDSSNLVGLTPVTMKESVELTSASYGMQILDRGTVANRECVNVLFTPKKKDRPTRKMCLDAGNGLPLKTEVFDTTGKLITVSSFSEIVFAPAFPDNHFMLMVPRNTRVVETQEITNLSLVGAAKILGVPIPLPSYIPEGYALREVTLLGKERPFKIQLAFGDGLSNLSIFQSMQKEPLASKNLKKVSLSGEKDGFFRNYGQSNLLTFRHRDSTITLIGEISPDEIIKIAGSFGR